MINVTLTISLTQPYEKKLIFNITFKPINILAVGGRPAVLQWNLGLDRYLRQEHSQQFNKLKVERPSCNLMTPVTMFLSLDICERPIQMHKGLLD